jgi:hypothetical protein
LYAALSQWLGVWDGMKETEQEDTFFTLFMEEIECKHPLCERYQPYQKNPNWTSCRIAGGTRRKFAMTVEQGSTNDMSTDVVEKKVDAKRSGCGASTSLHIRRNWMVIASWMTFVNRWTDLEIFFSYLPSTF